jgi:hypothetical protein
MKDNPEKIMKTEEIITAATDHCSKELAEFTLGVAMPIMMGILVSVLNFILNAVVNGMSGFMRPSA